MVEFGGAKSKKKLNGMEFRMIEGRRCFGNFGGNSRTNTNYLQDKRILGLLDACLRQGASTSL